MVSPIQWTWTWPNSGRWWGTGRTGVLWFMGSQAVGHDWETEHLLNSSSSLLAQNGLNHHTYYTANQHLKILIHFHFKLYFPSLSTTSIQGYSKVNDYLHLVPGSLYTEWPYNGRFSFFGNFWNRFERLKQEKSARLSN